MDSSVARGQRQESPAMQSIVNNSVSKSNLDSLGIIERWPTKYQDGSVSEMRSGKHYSFTQKQLDTALAFDEGRLLLIKPTVIFQALPDSSKVTHLHVPEGALQAALETIPDKTTRKMHIAAMSNAETQPTEQDPTRFSPKFYAEVSKAMKRGGNVADREGNPGEVVFDLAKEFKLPFSKGPFERMQREYHKNTGKQLTSPAVRTRVLISIGFREGKRVIKSMEPAPIPGQSSPSRQQQNVSVSNTSKGSTPGDQHVPLPAYTVTEQDSPALSGASTPRSTSARVPTDNRRQLHPEARSSSLPKPPNGNQLTLMDSSVARGQRQEWPAMQSIVSNSVSKSDLDKVGIIERWPTDTRRQNGLVSEMESGMHYWFTKKQLDTALAFDEGHLLLIKPTVIFQALPDSSKVTHLRVPEGALQAALETIPDKTTRKMHIAAMSNADTQPTEQDPTRFSPKFYAEVSKAMKRVENVADREENPGEVVFDLAKEFKLPFSRGPFYRMQKEYYQNTGNQLTSPTVGTRVLISIHIYGGKRMIKSMEPAPIPGQSSPSRQQQNVSVSNTSKGSTPGDQHVPLLAYTVTEQNSPALSGASTPRSTSARVPTDNRPTGSAGLGTRSNISSKQNVFANAPGITAVGSVAAVPRQAISTSSAAAKPSTAPTFRVTKQRARPNGNRGTGISTASTSSRSGATTGQTTKRRRLYESIANRPEGTEQLIRVPKDPNMKSRGTPKPVVGLAGSSDEGDTMWFPPPAAHASPSPSLAAETRKAADNNVAGKGTSRTDKGSTSRAINHSTGLSPRAPTAASTSGQAAATAQANRRQTGSADLGTRSNISSITGHASPSSSTALEPGVYMAVAEKGSLPEYGPPSLWWRELRL